MPSTYTKLHYHVVFAVKNREPMIADTWEKDLHAFLGGCIRQAGGSPLEIGGHREHVHILAGLKPIHRLSDVLCDIKSASSRWVHHDRKIPSFKWQEGYAALTASVKELDELRDYIRTQGEHHRQRTFMEEYIQMIKDMGIDFDMRFLP